MINVITSSRYKLNRKLIQQQTSTILSSYGEVSSLTINVVFIGKRKMKETAAKYKRENVALPVLSFLYEDTPQKGETVGEIVLCYPQVVLLAAERGKRVDDVIVSLIEHGINNLFSN